MTGPGLALIIIPIATTAALVAWLTMVFSADGQPGQADRKPVGTHASTPAKIAEHLPAAGATASRPLADIDPAQRQETIDRALDTVIRGL